MKLLAILSETRLALIICAAMSAGSLFADPQWESRAGNLPSWHIGYAIDAFDSTTAAVSVIQGGIHKTTDRGMHWTFLPFPGPLTYETAFDVSMPDPLALWAATGNGSILRWEARTGTWLVQFSDTNATKFMNFVRMFDLNNGIAMGDALSEPGPALFLRTTDGGTHWNPVNDSAFGGGSGDVWKRLDFLSPDVGYFYETGVNPQRLYKTTDGCAHWTVVGPDTLHPMVIKFANEAIGLIHAFWWRSSTVHGMCVARTLNGGSTWEVFARPEQGYGNDFEFIPGDPSRVWMTDNFRMYFSSDTGRSWTEKLTIGGRDLAFPDPSHGWLLGDDGRLLVTDNAGEVTSADRAPAGGAPGFRLLPNYPNPFNPVTHISYQVADRLHVRLAIFDLLGRQVVRLVDERKGKGEYTTTFNAAGYASGVYLCRLQAGGFVQTRAMMLVR